jgi:nicotinic acid phosphoribosyltransferase
MLFNRASFDWIQATVNSKLILPIQSGTRLSEYLGKGRADGAELANLTLSEEEKTALAKACPYFPPKYLDYLGSMRLDPVNQVSLTFVPRTGAAEDGEMGEMGEMGEIECVIKGLWRDCILYEVPVMSISTSLSHSARARDSRVACPSA